MMMRTTSCGALMVIATACCFGSELEQAEDWNYVVGMIAGLSEHWNLNFEGGFGERKSILAYLEYRFGKR